MSRARAGIAVIIPAYNAAPTLACAARSALHAASDAALEVVIVDDGSTDATGAVARDLAERDSRVRMISQQNRGLSAARNAGLDAAFSEFVVFLDADDALAPGSLDAQLRIVRDARSSCGAGVVGAWWCAPDEAWGGVERALAHDDSAAQSELAQAAWRVDPPARGVDARVLSQRNPAPAHAYLTATSAIGSLRFDESLPMLEDWDFLRRLAARGARWASAPIAGAVYRLRPASMSGADLRMCETAERVLGRADRGADTDRDSDAAMRRFALERSALAHCRGALGDGGAILDRWLHRAQLDAEAIGDAAAFALPHALRAPPTTWLGAPAQWLTALADWLIELEARGGVSPASRSEIARAIAERAAPPAAVAERIVERAQRAGVSIELVGLGANGRAILEAAERACVAVRVRDDAMPDAQAPLDGWQLPPNAALTTPDAPLALGSLVVLSPERDEALLARFPHADVRWRESRAATAGEAAQRIAGALSSAYAHAG